MKNVLIISYDWPPYGSVGMIRISRFVKYLIKSGYNISVLTKSNSGKGNVYYDIEEPLFEKVKVIRIKPTRERPLISYIREKIHPQFEAAWFYAVKDQMDSFLKDIDFDIVISSSPPESTHFLAALIKKKYKKKAWIADLRDLWSHDHYRSFDFLRRGILVNEEKNVLNKADSIITVSETWASFLKKRYGNKVTVIANGYDEEYFKKIPYKKRGIFTISYPGKLNSKHQDISVFLNTLRDIIKSGDIYPDKIKVNFYISGYNKPKIENLARQMGLSDIVKEHGPVPLSRALDVMKNSSLLLLVGWKGISAEGWRPQKVYEYIGSGTPMLLIGGSKNTELAKLVLSTQRGTIANDRLTVKKELMRYYSNFIANKINNRNVSSEEYKASSITKKLCDIIEKADA